MPLSRDECELVLRAGCCVAAIDGRLSRSEIRFIADALATAGAPTEIMTEKSILGVAKSVHRDGFQAAATLVREQLVWNRSNELLRSISNMSDAMATLDPAKAERVARLRELLMPRTPEPQEETKTRGQFSKRFESQDQATLADTSDSDRGWVSMFRDRITWQIRRLGLVRWVGCATLALAATGWLIVRNDEDFAAQRFRKDLFTASHRAAVAWDGESLPNDLRVEWLLLEPAVRTNEENAVAGLLKLVMEVQVCSASLTEIFRQSLDQKESLENAISHPLASGLMPLATAKFSEQLEMLNKGYVQVADADTRIVLDMVDKFAIPHVQGKFATFVEYRPARVQLSALSAATISTVGEMINNNGKPSR